MGGIGVVARLIVPVLWGSLQSLCWVNRIRLPKHGPFDGLGWRAPVHDVRGPEL